MTKLEEDSPTQAEKHKFRLAASFQAANISDELNEKSLINSAVTTLTPQLRCRQDSPSACTTKLLPSGTPVPLQAVNELNTVDDYKSVNIQAYQRKFSPQPELRSREQEPRN